MSDISFKNWHGSFSLDTRNFHIENTYIIDGFKYVLIYRLALYVYEYLLHVGAQKAAQTFLNEVNIWD